MAEVTKEQYTQLLERVAVLEKASKMGSKATKTKRPPSEYNIFVGKEIKRLNTEEPDLSRTKAFGKAVQAWKDRKPVAESK
jgi:hypothetical protein